MPIVSEDFGRSVINLNVDDTFFVDTNFIIATIDEGNELHEACYHLLIFLLEKNVRLLICETVLTESMHALGRMLYIESEITANHPDYASLPGREQRTIVSRIKSNFGNLPKQPNNLPSLAQANKEAKEMIEGVLELSIITIVPPRMEVFMNSMKLSHEIPLLSSDSIILAYALFAKVKGLISLDSDMKTAPIDIYTTQIKNHEFEDNIYD